jgi:hypothetical protein
MAGGHQTVACLAVWAVRRHMHLKRASTGVAQCIETNLSRIAALRLVAFGDCAVGRGGVEPLRQQRRPPP